MVEYWTRNLKVLGSIPAQGKVAQVSQRGAKVEERARKGRAREGRAREEVRVTQGRGEGEAR